MYKSIGIIGGMGPAATCDLMEKIIRNTKAEDDQHHIRIYVDNNTNIPDRTAAILHGGKNPLPELLESAVKLEAMGADLLIMPCNTAHYFYDQMQPFLTVPMLHMPRETAKLLADRGVKKAGLLATDGTIQTGVYKKALDSQGVEAVYPDAEDQKAVMSLIYDYVKKGILDREKLPEDAIRRTVDHLKKKGAEVMILGCTELPMAFAAMQMEDGCVDPTTVLARAAVRAAGAPCTQI